MSAAEKNHGADLVFTKNRPLRAAGQFAGKSAFTGPRKTGHDNDHCALNKSNV